MSSNHDHDSASRRGRPSAELLARLRHGKTVLREHRLGLTLPEKVEQLLRLQEIYVAIIAKRRALKPWERPWRIEP